MRENSYAGMLHDMNAGCWLRAHVLERVCLEEGVMRAQPLMLMEVRLGHLRDSTSMPSSLMDGQYATCS